MIRVGAVVIAAFMLFAPFPVYEEALAYLLAVPALILLGLGALFVPIAVVVVLTGIISFPLSSDIFCWALDTFLNIVEAVNAKELALGAGLIAIACWLKSPLFASLGLQVP